MTDENGSFDETVEEVDETDEGFARRKNNLSHLILKRSLMRNLIRLPIQQLIF